MKNAVEFIFMDKVRTCSVYVDMAADPRYVFVELLDKDLIGMFGEEITIVTDFNVQLSRPNEHLRNMELKKVIFDSIQALPEFAAARERLHNYTAQSSKH